MIERSGMFSEAPAEAFRATDERGALGDELVTVYAFMDWWLWVGRELTCFE